MRVVPRDLFNESKLLKCLGQLSVNILDGKLHKYGTTDLLEDEYEGFRISQSEDGDIFVDNYHVLAILGGQTKVKLKLYSRLNSREPYPLICETHDGSPEYVFADNGKFTKEFLNYIKELYEFVP
jgi:hypothetical protein